jgi:hypothetical protein
LTRLELWLIWLVVVLPLVSQGWILSITEDERALHADSFDINVQGVFNADGENRAQNNQPLQQFHATRLTVANNSKDTRYPTRRAACGLVTPDCLGHQTLTNDLENNNAKTDNNHLLHCFGSFNSSGKALPIAETIEVRIANYLHITLPGHEELCVTLKTNVPIRCFKIPSPAISQIRQHPIHTLLGTLVRLFLLRYRAEIACVGSSQFPLIDDSRWLNDSVASKHDFPCERFKFGYCALCHSATTVRWTKLERDAHGNPNMRPTPTGCVCIWARWNTTGCCMPPGPVGLPGDNGPTGPTGPKAVQILSTAQNPTALYKHGRYWVKGYKVRNQRQIVKQLQQPTARVYQHRQTRQFQSTNHHRYSQPHHQHKSARSNHQNKSN